MRGLAGNQPVARFHVRRLASGRIYIVKHGDTMDTHEGRSKLKAWFQQVISVRSH